jgi:hypothetical protein
LSSFIVDVCVYSGGVRSGESDSRRATLVEWPHAGIFSRFDFLVLSPFFLNRKSSLEGARLRTPCIENSRWRDLPRRIPTLTK